MTAPEIIEKLRPKLREEGLEVDFLGREGEIVNIRARRVAPGVPVAFLVKAIAGTYRRYMPEIVDVCLAEYDPGEEIGTAASETFEPVFKHKPVAQTLALAGIPVLDLSGLDRRQAVKSLENFFRMWKARSALLGVQGLEEDAPKRAAQKWASVYREEYQEIDQISDARWNIVLDRQSVEASRNLEEETMPGRIFLTDESVDEAK